MTFTALLCVALVRYRHKPNRTEHKQCGDLRIMCFGGVGGDKVWRSGRDRRHYPWRERTYGGEHMIRGGRAITAQVNQAERLTQANLSAQMMAAFCYAVTNVH